MNKNLKDIYKPHFTIGIDNKFPEIYWNNFKRFPSDIRIDIGFPFKVIFNFWRFILIKRNDGMYMFIFNFQK